MSANAPVTAKLPVIVPLPPGKNARNGINPKKLAVNIKKKKVVMRGVHRLASFLPIFGIMILFLIKSIKISKRLENFDGNAFLFLRYLDVIFF